MVGASSPAPHSGDWLRSWTGTHLHRLHCSPLEHLDIASDVAATVGIHGNVGAFLAGAVCPDVDKAARVSPGNHALVGSAR